MTLEEILEEVLNVKPDDAKDELELVNIDEWDSMAHMILITRIEEGFEIQLSQDDIVSMQSIGKIREILKKHGA